MNNAELEQFYERIMDAVMDTVEICLKCPFGFHGDTGMGELPW